jgi:hypothetical protein
MGQPTQLTVRPQTLIAVRDVKASSQQSVQPHDASADVDVGPGQVEPVLVGGAQ